MVTKYSFIFPIHNEELIIEQQLQSFLDVLKKLYIKQFEIICVENGSTDLTRKLLERFSEIHPLARVRVFHLEKASYGLALKQGLLVAEGEIIVVQDIDFIDADFLSEGLSAIKKYQMVIGSKNLQKNRDHRAIETRYRTEILSFIVQKMFGYAGTDTHGPKILRNSPRVQRVVLECFTQYEFFSTEFVLRLVLDGFRIHEIPVSTVEIRPTRYRYFRRWKLCLLDLWRLFLRNITSDFYSTRRGLQVNADDYGWNEDVNKMIVAMNSSGAVQRISILANMVTPSALGELRRKNDSDAIFHLHWNLFRGHPVSSVDAVWSLVNSSGEFYSLPVFAARLLFGKIRVTHLWRELDAQLGVLESAGIRPVVIDSEQHAHTLEPMWSVVGHFAQSRGIAIRSRQSTEVFLRLFLHKYVVWWVLRVLLRLRYPASVLTVKRETVQIIHPGNDFD